MLFHFVFVIRISKDRNRRKYVYYEFDTDTDELRAQALCEDGITTHHVYTSSIQTVVKLIANRLEFNETVYYDETQYRKLVALARLIQK